MVDAFMVDAFNVDAFMVDAFNVDVFIGESINKVVEALPIERSPPVNESVNK